MLTGFSIIVTPDGLKAYLQIPPKTTVFPSDREILAELCSRGINTGIDLNSISEIAHGKKSAGLIEVAKGIPSKPGTSAKIEILVDISRMGKPRELLDGRVDHHEISSVINVKKGDRIARRIPPSDGIEGMSVFGTIIPPQQPHDVQFIPRAGTEIESGNDNMLISSIDGALTIDKSGFAEVRNEKVVDKDIDYSTGNICFSGDLLIKGSVRAGFNVEVDGDLRVLGNVEDTHIKSGGDVEIEGGAVGAGTGVIESRGYIKARHVENFSIKSGDNVIISEDVLHSSIFSEGKISAKSIIGGSVCAYGIECESIGSTAETKTVLDIGRMHALLYERDELKKKYAEQYDVLKTNNKQIFILVRDNMDESGHLDSQKEETLLLIKNKSVETKKTCDKIKQRIDTIDTLEKTLGAISGISAGCIYPNTIIKFGNGERQIQDIMHDVKLFARS